MLTNSQVGTYTYPTQGPGSIRPHAVTAISGGPLGSQSFPYDPNGSMTGQGPDTRSYDGENRLVSATDGGTTTTFVYGPDGARLKKIAGGATTLYFGDDLEVIPGATPQYIKYLPGDARRVDFGAVTWLHRDHLQSVRALTSATGAILDRANYRPFGEQQGFATETESKGFIGQRLDDETGLLYLHARYYDPVLARFVQADPLDAAEVGIDRYAYAHNNPVMMLDPTGLDPTDHDKGSGKNYGSSGTPANGNCGGRCGARGDRDPRTGRVRYGTFNDVLSFFGIEVSQAYKIGGRLVAEKIDGVWHVYDAKAWFAATGQTAVAQEEPPIPKIGGSGWLILDAVNWVQEKILGKPLSDAELVAISYAIDDLAAFRRDLGLPPAPQDEKTTLAALILQGKVFYGISANGQTVTLSVNAISRWHAETDVFQQAANAQITSGAGILVVDRELCDACGANGMVKSLAKQIGLQELSIVTPKNVDARIKLD